MSDIRDRIRDLRSRTLASSEEMRVPILRALDRSYVEGFEVCAYRSVLEISSIVESDELYTAFEEFKNDFKQYDIDLISLVDNPNIKQKLVNCRSPYLQAKILVSHIAELPNADDLTMILHGEDSMELAAAAVEVVASMHLLEKISRPLQVAYARLRQEYGVGCHIDIDPKTDSLNLSFTRSDSKLRTSSEFAACTVTMAKSGGKMRVKGCSKEFGDVNKLGLKARDVVYAIDSWLDKD